MASFLKYQLLSLCFVCQALWGCSQTKIGPMTVKPLPTVNRLDTLTDHSGKKHIYKFANYTVSHFDYSSAQTREIDSLVQTLKPADIAQYDQYSIYFYKESDYTNNQHLKDNPRDLQRHSNQYDWIYEANWERGQFFTRHIVKDGDFIYDKDSVKVEIKARKHQ